MYIIVIIILISFFIFFITLLVNILFKYDLKFGGELMDSKKIGLFIKELRQKNNMSQNALAEKIPINREAISKWENGRTIPDSSTLIRLSEIFKVSIDEIMFGEYKSKENEKKLQDINLMIYDDRNLINKKYNKTAKFLVVSLIVLLIMIVSFLLYYFLNSYDSVKIYTIESVPDDIYLTDGTIMLTGESVYFRLGNVNGIDENKIEKIVLYYDYKGNRTIIYKGTSGKDALIRDFYDYNEYFEIKNKNIKFDSLFVDIYYDNKVKNIQLIMKEDYSNKKIFFSKSKKTKLQKSESKEIISNDIINIIKKNFQEENGLYFKKIKIKGKLYNINYADDSASILIYWKDKKYNYSITYDAKYDSASYNKMDMELNLLDDCYFEKNKSQEYNCDSIVVDTLNSVFNEIIRGGS